MLHEKMKNSGEEIVESLAHYENKLFIFLKLPGVKLCVWYSA